MRKKNFKIDDSIVIKEFIIDKMLQTFDISSSRAFRCRATMTVNCYKFYTRARESQFLSHFINQTADEVNQQKLSEANRGGRKINACENNKKRDFKDIEDFYLTLTNIFTLNCITAVAVDSNGTRPFYFPFSKAKKKRSHLSYQT